MKVDVYQGYLYDDSIPKNYSVMTEVVIKGSLPDNTSENKLKTVLEKLLTSKTYKEYCDRIDFDNIKIRNNKFKVEICVYVIDNYYEFEYAATTNDKNYRHSVEKIVTELLQNNFEDFKVRAGKFRLLG